MAISMTRESPLQKPPSMFTTPVGSSKNCGRRMSRPPVPMLLSAGSHREVSTFSNLINPRAELRAKIEAAEQELHAWQSAREVAVESVPARERALEWSQRKLHDAAIAVLKESAPVAQLADELDDLQDV